MNSNGDFLLEGLQSFKATTASQELLDFVYKHLDPVALPMVSKIDRIFICGGAVRAFYDQSEVKDVDFYFQDMETADLFRNILTASTKYKTVAYTDNATTLAHETLPSVQIIHPVSYTHLTLPTKA